jgi:hypothetical protein
MAQTARNLPANYPQPLGNQILKADALRQVSMVRQEIVTDLLAVLPDTHEPAVRARLVKLVEGHLKTGMAAALRSQELWPDMAKAKEIIHGDEKLKPATVKKQLRLFEQLDLVQRRSLALLENSFTNIRLILDRMQTTVPLPNTASPASKVSAAK